MPKKKRLKKKKLKKKQLLSKMGFDLLRTKGDVTKITALNRSAIALRYHT